VPADFLDRHIGTGLPAMLLMVLVGLPMYVCATSSTPLAAVLIAKGLSPGAALVFLLVGPATNLATMLVVGRQLGLKSLGVYILTIALVALLMGLATDALLTSVPAWEGSIHCLGHDSPGWASWPFAIALTVLILNGLRRRFAK